VSFRMSKRLLVSEVLECLGRGRRLGLGRGRTKKAGIAVFFYQTSLFLIASTMTLVLDVSSNASP